ncbi:formyltransferase family protein [Desulfovibrio sp. JC022]|uniref:formyltransferase family protein n=1 Tax=Desulfovibrio sp. JC022 TaxID=2593642 RepID=UPI0013D77ADF|nr:formyltransferase family protein [Desulfovibrio sp. JC022]
MSEQKNRVLFLGKKDDSCCLKALKFCETNFSAVTAYLGEWGEKFPAEIDEWEGEFVISYLSRWVIPQRIIEKAKCAAINFHPATPDYPGIGCNNFALYEEAKEYGVTCHHMLAAVDTGDVIAVKKFSLYPDDTVDSVLSRTYDTQIMLFYEVMDFILKGEELPKSDLKWSRKPFTRKEFDQLGKITPDMSKEEMARRIRATSYGQWQPTVELNGFVFKYNPEKQK